MSDCFLLPSNLSLLSPSPQSPDTEGSCSREETEGLDVALCVRTVTLRASCLPRPSGPSLRQAFVLWPGPPAPGAWGLSLGPALLPPCRQWSALAEESCPSSGKVRSLAGLMIAQERRGWCQSLLALLPQAPDGSGWCPSSAPLGAQVGTAQLSCIRGAGVSWPGGGTEWGCWGQGELWGFHSARREHWAKGLSTLCAG